MDWFLRATGPLTGNEFVKEKEENVDGLRRLADCDIFAHSAHLGWSGDLSLGYIR